MRRLSSLVAVGSIGAAAIVGCASHMGATKGAKSAGPQSDANACARICEASAACGDSPEVCVPKCQDWLVARSRPGIASETAICAIPRIDGVCANHEYARAAATALVSCIDEAGRKALAVDRSSLFLAARAICDRGARCNDASDEEAALCVEKITAAGKIPRGLGIFGAMKPALVQRFARCMSQSECGPSAGGSVCFGEMLGEDTGGDDEDDGDDAVPATPGKPSKPPVEEGPDTPGTKI